MTTQLPADSSWRRIAVLVSGLDSATADLLLDQLDEAQASRVRQAVMDLGDVTHYEEEQILSDFHGACAGDEAPEDVERPRPVEDRPFEFLQDATPRTVANLLSREHPQVVAVVMAHLPPDVAARIMAPWTDTVQADVLSRVAHLDELHPDALRALEDAIAGLVAGSMRTRIVRSSGVTAVESIVANLQRSGRTDVLSHIARRDADLAATLQTEEEDHHSPPMTPPSKKPSIADPPRKPHVEFEDLESLSATDWATLLRSVKSETMLLALAGAPGGILEALKRLAPASLLKSLDKRLRELGPLQLEDIDRAQTEIADAAAALIVEGQLSPLQPRHFAAAV